MKVSSVVCLLGSSLALTRAGPLSREHSKRFVSLGFPSCDAQQNNYIFATDGKVTEKISLAQNTNDGRLWNLYFGQSDSRIVKDYFNTILITPSSRGCSSNPPPACSSNTTITQFAFCPSYFNNITTHISGCDDPSKFPSSAVAGQDLQALQLRANTLNAQASSFLQENQRIATPPPFIAAQGGGLSLILEDKTSCVTYDCVTKLVQQAVAKPDGAVLTQYMAAAYVLFAQAIWANHADECTKLSA